MIGTCIAIFKLIAFLCFTPPMMVLQIFILKFNIGNKTWVPQFYNKTLCQIIGIQILVSGELPVNGLIVSNHISWKDILVLNALIPVSLIAKHEVGGWPMFGSLARLQGTIFINRTNKRSMLASLDEMQARLKNGNTLVLFPEGTTHTGKSVLPFKSSFFAAAERSSTAVIPVTLIYQTQHGLPLTLRQRPDIAWYGDGTLAPHLWGVLKAGPISVKVIIHAPLQSANRKVLAKKAQKQISASLAENLHAGAKIG